ncbi:MAG: MATE family efflux transporter, partial [bacterium]
MIKKLIEGFSNNDFFKKSFITLIIRLSGVFFQFLILIITTKFFSEEIVGQFNYINTVLILLSSICMLGMGESFLLFSGKFEAENNETIIMDLYRKNIFILILSFSSLLLLYTISLKLFDFSFFTSTNTVLFNKIFSVLFFSSISLYNFQVIRGLRKLVLSEAFRNLIRYGLIFSIILTILILDQDPKYILNSFIIAFSLIAFSTSLIVGWHFKNIHKEANSRAHNLSTRTILLTSIPMSISFLSLLTMQSFDTIMIEYFINVKSVAFYTVAVKVTFIVGIMQLTINAVIAPDISKYWFENSEKKLTQLINKAIKLNFIFTFPIILILVIFSEPILLFLGESYLNSKTPLIVLLAGQVLNSFCGPVGLYLNMTERQNVLLKILLIATLINIILNLFLIPKHGLFGAAVSTSI